MKINSKMNMWDGRNKTAAPCKDEVKGEGK